MKRFLSLILLAGALLCSCNKTVTPTISLDNHAETFTWEGGTAKTTVTCNCSWSADCETEGVVIYPVSHVGDTVVTITVPSIISKTTEAVRVTFTATADESTATTKFVATVISKPYISILQGGSAVKVPSVANGVIINIESNDEWEYAPSAETANLTVSPQCGTFNQEVTVSFPANTELAEKQYELTFRLKNDNNVSAKVLFTQSKAQ